MGEWKEFSLLDFSEIHNQTRIPLSKMEREKRQGRFPYYGASGIIDYVDDFLFDGEFVLISEDGENLKSRQTPIAFKAAGKFWVNNHAHILRGKKDFHNDLIIYYFKNLDLNSYITGAVQPKLNKENLLSIPIILSDNETEQKAIASVLSSLDDKIDLLHRQNKTLEAMAETLFRQWFVEEAQEDWEDGELSYFAENPRKSIKPVNINAGTKYIGLEHIDRRNISLNQVGSAQEVASNKYQFAENDILFGKLRPYFHKVCFAPFEGVCSTDILVIRPKQPLYFTFCLFAFFQDDVVEYANLGSEGTRMPRTNWEVLRQYPAQIPDVKALQRFNQLTSPSIEKIKQNLAQIRTLEKLRDTLLPKLMSGEVRVEYAP